MALNSSFLKKNNTLSVIRCVKCHSGISKPEIAKLTGLTSVTVNTIISELQSKNLVFEGGLADSSGGRKAKTYAFNNSAFCCIGIDMRIGSPTVGLYDMSGNALCDKLSFELSDECAVGTSLEQISSNINKLIATNSLAKKSLTGIGVSVPGRVDNTNGIIKVITNLKQWCNIPIAQHIESAVDLPVIVDRDTNAASLYLKWQQDINDSLFISIDEGVGSSLLVDGNIFYGAHNLAGELGHMTVDSNGPLCNCGNFGCIETLASNGAILRDYYNICKSKNIDVDFLKDVIGKRSLENDYIVKLANDAANGDSNANTAFRNALKHIETLLINAINTTDISSIIIECPWLNENNEYFNIVESGVFLRTKFIDRTDLKIQLNTIDNIFTKAPSALALNHWLEKGNSIY